MSPADPLDRLASRGAQAYFGEPVTILEHSLQTAALASDADASPALVLAALLHDLGHLMHTAGEDASERGVDTRHERIGARALRTHYGAEVAEPVRLHVDAKRWLCAREPGYRAALAPESQRSLELQGGPFTPEQADAFEALPGARDAIRLRRWDDQAKIAGLSVPPLDAYRRLAALLARTPER